MLLQLIARAYYAIALRRMRARALSRLNASIRAA